MLELKFIKHSSNAIRVQLIIVQCLNWNRKTVKVEAIEKRLIIVQCLNWNFGKKVMISICLVLIIVQCLNWNGEVTYSFAKSDALIIVQCLNWNVFPRFVVPAAASYNRTMLELKLRDSMASKFTQCAYNRTMLELKSSYLTGQLLHLVL